MYYTDFPRIIGNDRKECQLYRNQVIIQIEVSQLKLRNKYIT